MKKTGSKKSRDTVPLKEKLSRLIRQELGAAERVECETVDSYQGHESLFCLMFYSCLLSKRKNCPG
jgi:hypothetical protein